MKIHDPAMKFAALTGPESLTDSANHSGTYREMWEAGLAKNQDPYGKAVYRFASEWATRMESAIAAGETVEECAERTSREADDEGITGFMYGGAVSMLSHWWVHGEQLRRWHNLGTQLGAEGEDANANGGVLNPAIVNISPKA